MNLSNDVVSERQREKEETERETEGERGGSSLSLQVKYVLETSCNFGVDGTSDRQGEK